MFPRHPFILALALICCALSPVYGFSQISGFKQTGAGPYDYGSPGNWVNGEINGAWSPSLVLTANQTVTFASDAALPAGWIFRAGGGHNLTLRSEGGPFALTLSGNVDVCRTPGGTITIGGGESSQALAIDLGGGIRTLTITGSGNGGNFGNTLSFLNSVSNGGILVSGSGTGGGKVLFNGAVTLDSLSICDAEVSFGAGAQATVNGPLSAQNGSATVTLAAGTAGNSLLKANAFTRKPGTTILFRGDGLGQNAMAATAVGGANISLATSPPLIGANEKSGILAGAFGDTSASGSGFGATGGLVTYDEANGVRLLTPNEYSPSITGGSKQPENVRYANSTGSPVTTSLPPGTTVINSLSFAISGPTENQGVTVSGDSNSVLRINSGVIFADQNVTGDAGPALTDAMTICVPVLDLNAMEGIILASTRMNAGGTVQSNAGLVIESAITNASGLTIADGMGSSPGGFVTLGGEASNTYKGITTVNGAIVKLAKKQPAQRGGANEEDESACVDAIGGDVVLNLGSIYDAGNQIANSSRVTIHGGTFFLNGSNNSGSASNETINGLSMTGGQVSSGSGNGNTFQVIGSMDLAGGTINVPVGGKLIVGGKSVFSGGVLALESSSNDEYNAKSRLSGEITITNTYGGPYVPIRIAPGGSPLLSVGQLEIGGDLTFVGNDSNVDTLTINAPTGAGTPGVIALDGVRSFTIGKGAASVDFSIQAPLINGPAEGGLKKLGPGTLALQGANTYTGATTVFAGTLLFNGTGVSPVTVNGGVLTGSGALMRSVTIGNGAAMEPGDGVGTMSTGDLALVGPLAKLGFEISGAGPEKYDQIKVTGSLKLTGGGQIAVHLKSFVPSATDVFFLILNDASEPIKGTLAGLPQGAVFRSDDVAWQISYLGDAASNSFLKAGGNDLAIRMVSEALPSPAPTR